MSCNTPTFFFFFFRFHHFNLRISGIFVYTYIYIFYLDRCQLPLQRRPQSWTAGDSQRLGDHWEPGTCSFHTGGFSGSSVCPIGARAALLNSSDPVDPRWVTGLSLPLPSRPFPFPLTVRVDSASALQRPATASKSEIKSKSGSQTELQPF